MKADEQTGGARQVSGDRSAPRECEPDLDFSYGHYSRILARIRQTHRVLSFADAAALGRAILDIPRFVIMRHDVEFSPQAACRLAQLDSEAGVRSTFFLLPSGDYNCFDEENAGHIRQILALGHDIGLHYDAGLYQRLGLTPGAAALAQIDALQRFFGIRITAMSAHQPTRTDARFTVPGVVDAYAPLYFAEIRYLSDSLQKWREGVVTGLLDRYARIQLLTHECNWSEEGFGWDEIMERHVTARLELHRDRTRRAICDFRRGLATRDARDADFRRRHLSGRPDAPAGERS